MTFRKRIEDEEAAAGRASQVEQKRLKDSAEARAARSQTAFDAILAQGPEDVGLTASLDEKAGRITLKGAKASIVIDVHADKFGMFVLAHKEPAGEIVRGSNRRAADIDAVVNYIYDWGRDLAK